MYACLHGSFPPYKNAQPKGASAKRGVNDAGDCHSIIEAAKIVREPVR
jgi:hypothetical protein